MMKKSPSARMAWAFACVRVRVHDNIRPLRLTENLGQLNGRHPM
ncbi:MAG: hypothetical protein ACLS69_04705 [Butyricicoccus sp.]